MEAGERERMMKKDVCKVFVLIVCIEVVYCKLPSEQVSAITSVFDIIQNHHTAYSNFVWTKNSNPCLWSGVYCNPDYSSIIKVSFSEFGISSSEFLPFLCNITTLESVDVSYNNLISIPDGFLSGCGNLSGLKHLDFSWNRLDGPLPSLNGFKMLEFLDFSWNSLSGEISHQLDGLVSLKVLYLSRNKFKISSSEFLPFLCNITTLESVDVSWNDLSSIPDGFLSGCGNIKHLDFSRNRLDGPLPSLNGFKMLDYLDFSYNLLSGEISHQLDGLVSLKFLNLGENQFKGRIPRNVGKLNLLENLVLDGNSLTGSIPGELAHLTRLQRLDLSWNQLSGAIPTWISNITTLRVFEAHYNHLNGSIPSGITSHLTVLSLYNNKLTGRIPSDLLSGPYLESLYLSENELEGPIPAMNSTRLSQLYLESNDLNGTIPWDSMGTLLSLGHLSLSDNRLTGTLPPVLGNLTNLRRLWLDSNDFVGAIPPEISHLNLLKELHISRNSLNGSIPSSISMMKNINFFYLEGNNLHGPMPDSIGNLSSLYSLSLGDNQLSGSIPDSIRTLSYLGELRLGHNQLSGSIPDSIRTLSSLAFLHLGNNRLSGRIPDMPQSLQFAFLSFNLFDGNIPITLLRLVRLKALDLQSNNLHGPIPDSIGNLTSLEYLGLGNNQLSGPIPNTIRKLSSLKQLQLANNQLTAPIPYMPDTLQIALNLSCNLFDGPIPDALSNLWKLDVLDLSNNRFSGQIPDSLTRLSCLTHLLLINNNLSGVVSTFPNDVQVDKWGNPNLIDPRQNPTPAGPHRKKKSVHPEFFVAAATGFPVGVLIWIIAIFISRRYHRIHGILSTPNTIHKPIIHFNKAMQAVSDPSNITVKATFSTFYKAIMPSGTTYLVKKFNHTNQIFQFPRHKELVEELEVLGELSNPNVMIPVAYLLTTRRAYLFYDFVRGTLYDILHHRMGCRLDWASRFTIAVGVSKGLAFLHQCTSGPIIVLDLCSKSILLKSMDVPQISDIELCSLIHPSKTKECMAALDASSVGYVPPEYGSTKRVTAAGNVYSFGVVLLELVTGKPAVSEGSELAKWVLSISEQGDRWDEILDSSVSETSVGVRNQMVEVVKVAFACINISPEMRPNSATVLQMLQNRH